VWGYALVWFLINDLMKVRLVRLLDLRLPKYEAQLARGKESNTMIQMKSSRGNTKDAD